MPNFSNLTKIAEQLPHSMAKKYNAVVDRQTRVRINVAVYAYAYEIMDDPVATDAEFDNLCAEVKVSIDTRNQIMDKWFRDNFSPHTGSWVWSHPDKAGLHKYYLLWRKHKKNGTKQRQPN